MTKFDLDLFLELNEEYRSKPLVPAPPKYDAASLADRSARRAAKINKRVSVKGKRFLEVGCGRGEMCRSLARDYGCSTVGVDVFRYDEWEEIVPNVQLLARDLSRGESDDLGVFDVIYSNSVWEHLRHPFSMLKVVHQRLSDDGDFLLSANLYRGPKASHRYRQVFFPWPHLLFSDEVFEDFYQHLDGETRGDHRPGAGAVDDSTIFESQSLRGPVWVNQLSIADYLLYFKLSGFEVIDLRYSITPIDEPFYERFSDKLERFPRFDLERDFIHAHLRKSSRLLSARLIGSEAVRRAKRFFRSPTR